jgi:hypothetical protein
MRPKCLLAAGGISLLVLSSPCLAEEWQIVVDKTDKKISFISSAPGEGQSTVVQPSLKGECPSGRFVFTNDKKAFRPPTTGAVQLRDLMGSNGAITLSTFDAIPIATTNYLFGTNDNDVITMPNGDIVLVWGVHFASPLSPKPAWFDVTVFDPTNPTGFKPGVRRGSMVWRSSDCGLTFKYMAALDPAMIADGSCALPQGKPPWYKNGGSDGQLVKVDVDKNRLFLMFPCMGYTQDTTKAGFALSKNKLAKTMVMTSSDEGASWTFLGWNSEAGWRYQVAPFKQDRLATAIAGKLYFGEKLSNGSYQFDTSPTIPMKPQTGWDVGTWAPSNPLISGTTKVISANVLASTVMTRAPGTQKRLITAFYDLVLGSDGKLGRGYRVMAFDFDTKKFAELASIEPKDRSTNSFVMHLAAIDPGSGPILLYWTDVDAKNNRALVRGRLVTSVSEYSDDFPLSRELITSDPAQKPTISAARYFPLGTNSYWYGDYRSASGYAENAGGYDYFPMWIEPDNSVRFTRVVAKRQLEAKSTTGRIFRKWIPKWHPRVPPVEAARFQSREAEMMDEDEGDLTRGEAIVPLEAGKR